MAKINILTPEIFNKIAAGEVVEKPASVVKEVVENSIDAGATKIDIQIYDGGISKIIVSDNGSGILPDDLEPAFLPHATSKISNEADLYNISTLGFRGEALASIASVSQVEVISKTASTNGHSIKVSGGQIVAKGEKGSPVGTYISVENLFFNTPARQKFLKKPKKEESDITTLVAKLILANPKISFKYSADGKVVYTSSGQGLQDAIFAIYGAQIIENLIPIDFSDGKYTLSGFIGKTSFFKANRTYQTIMINGRWVADSIVNVALSQCYESYMMKRCFPFCVINLTMPSDELDVNVHPSKLEVRFQDSRAIFAFVYKAISEAIYQDLTKKTTDEVTAPQEELPFTLTRAPEVAPVNNEKVTQDLNVDFVLDSPAFKGDGAMHTSADSVLNEIVIEKLAGFQPINAPNFGVEEPTKIDYIPKPTQQQLIQDNVVDKDAFLSSRIVGKVFNTFIILELDDDLYFIDQHAAHERLLFDRYVKQVKGKAVTSQPLLLPYNIEVNHAEEQFILDNIEMLRSLGFDIEPFGNLLFKISAIPSILPNLNVENFFQNFLANLNNYTQMKSIDLIRDNLAETACKHAVKGGDDLDKEELVKLVREVGDGNTTLQCPHGRPFVVKFSHRDIDKWFKRIV